MEKKYKVYPPFGYKFPTEDGSREMDAVEILLHPLFIADLTGENGFDLAVSLCEATAKVKTPEEAVQVLEKMGFEISIIK